MPLSLALLWWCVSPKSYDHQLLPCHCCLAGTDCYCLFHPSTVVLSFFRCCLVVTDCYCLFHPSTVVLSFFHYCLVVTDCYCLFHPSTVVLSFFHYCLVVTDCCCHHLHGALESCGPLPSWGCSEIIDHLSSYCPMDHHRCVDELVSLSTVVFLLH